MSKERSIISVDFCTLLFLLFLGLKLTGHIDWSWWWVTAPLWWPLALLGAVLGTMGVLLAIGAVVAAAAAVFVGAVTAIESARQWRKP